MKELTVQVKKLITDRICDNCGHDSAIFMCYLEETRSIGFASKGTSHGIEEMILGLMQRNEDFKNAVLGIVAFDFADEVMNIIAQTARMERDN